MRSDDADWMFHNDPGDNDPASGGNCGSCSKDDSGYLHFGGYGV